MKDTFKFSLSVEILLPITLKLVLPHPNGGLHDLLQSYASVIDVGFSNDFYDSENDIIFGGEES